MLLLTTQTYEHFVHEHAIAMILFKAKNCAPCIAVQNKLESFHQTHPTIAIAYVENEQCLELAASLGIFSASSVVVYVDGNMVIKEIGYYSVERIFDKVLRYESLLTE